MAGREQAARKAVVGEFRTAILGLLGKIAQDTSGFAFPQDHQHFIDRRFAPSFARLDVFDNTLALYRTEPPYSSRLAQTQEFVALYQVISNNHLLRRYFLAGMRSSPPADSAITEDSVILGCFIIYKQVLHGLRYGRTLEETVGMVCGQILGDTVMRVRRTLLRNINIERTFYLDASNCVRPVDDADRERWERTRLAEMRQYWNAQSLGIEDITAIFESYDEPCVDQLVEGGLTRNEARFRLIFGLVFECDLPMHLHDWLAIGFRNTEEGKGSIGWRKVASSSENAIPVQITDGGISRLEKLWKSIQSIEEHKRFRLACRRWLSALGRDDDADHLIDIWIALEALFSPSDKAEVSLRLALRGAAFSGYDSKNAVKLFKALKKSYRERSGLVHGTSDKIDKERLVVVRTFVREILIKIADMAHFDPEGIEEGIVAAYAASRVFEN